MQRNARVSAWATRDGGYTRRAAPTARTRAAAGGRALYLDSVLQRQFRDCFAAAAHHSVVWDGAAAEYGKTALAVANARLRN